MNDKAEMTNEAVEWKVVGARLEITHELTPAELREEARRWLYDHGNVDCKETRKAKAILGKAHN
jgi:hypothetical protein